VGEPERDGDAEAIERGEPSVLSEREAMSILTSAGSDEQTSAFGEESVTSGDRGEHIESRDSG
jgi:hypothetical protein